MRDGRRWRFTARLRREVWQRRLPHGLLSPRYLWPGRDRRIRAHRGLIAAFGERLVKTGLIHAELGRSINQVEGIHLLADDTGEVIDREKAQWAIDQVDALVAVVSGFNA